MNTEPTLGGQLEPIVGRQYWEPHPLDSWGQRRLLEIAHAANPPAKNAEWWREVTLPAPDGWQVCFFYDCGELDYIDHFLTPEGERLEVWCTGYSSGQWPPVMNWRGTDDTDRLCADLPPNAQVTGLSVSEGPVD